MSKLNRRDLLRKIADSNASGGGTYFRDGQYRLAIKKLELNSGYNGSKFVASFVVVNAIQIPVYGIKAEKALDIVPNPVGSEFDWLQMLDEHDSAFGNVKAFVLALFNENEGSVTNDEFLETLTELCDLDKEGDPLKEPKEPAKGLCLDMTTYRKVTKEKQIEIVLPKWAYVEQTPEHKEQIKTWIAQVNAQLGAAKASTATA